jgi:hypothetical protein
MFMSASFLYLFITLTGFIIGLGAVTVIDLHGFLGRHSPYWTEATIRTHKVTKPLIWIGMILASVGVFLLERHLGWIPLTLTQAGISLALIGNGCFLSFWVSPRLLAREREGRSKELLPTSWQGAITVSFFISFFGWWGEVALLAWYLVQ